VTSGHNVERGTFFRFLSVTSTHLYALTTNPFPATHPPPYEPEPLSSLLQKSANLTPSRADAGGSNAVGSGHLLSIPWGLLL